MRERVDTAAALAEAVDPGVERVRKDMVHRVVTRRQPADGAAQPPHDHPARRLQARTAQIPQHGPNRAELRVEREDALDCVADRLIGGDVDVLAAQATLETDRQRKQERSTLRFVQPAALHACPDLVTLDFRERAFQAEQEAVIDLSGIVEAVLVSDEHIEGGGELEQRVPVQAIAGQARDL